MKSFDPNGWLLAREISALAGVTPRAVQLFAKSAPDEAKEEVRGRGGRAWRLLVSALPERWRARIIEASPSTALGANSSQDSGFGGGPTGEGAAPVAAHCVGALPAAIESPHDPTGQSGSPREGDTALATSPARKNQGGEPLTSPTPGKTAALVSSPLFAEAALPYEVEKQLAALDSERQRQALDRYLVIEPMENGDWKKFLGRALEGGAVIRTKNDFVSWLAAQQHPPVSPGTLWRWRQAFHRRGLAGLIKQPRRDKGLSRAFSAQDRADLASLYLQTGNARAAHREFCRQKNRQVTYGAVKRFVATLPRPVVSRALNGRKAFNDSQLPYTTRRNLQPNEAWVADHTPFDLFVNAWGKACRPWLSAFMDMGSRQIVGWCLSLQPDSLTLASAFRMGALACGLPGAVYLDNGKPERSRYLAGAQSRRGFQRPDLNGETRGLFAELGVRIIYATPFHPQAKSIERFFGTLHRQFDPDFRSYCGNRPGNRPDTCQALIAEHKECVQRGVPDASPLPTLTELALALRLWLEEEYHRHPHRGLRGRSPAEAYEPSDRRIPAERLDLLLLKREVREVRRGAVEIFGRRYEAEGAALFLHNGHQAEVAYDPHERVFSDLSRVLVLCCGRAFTCRSLEAPETHEQLRARLRERRQLTAVVERYILEVHRRASVVSPGERRLAAVAAALPEIDRRAVLKSQISSSESVEAPLALPEAAGVVEPDYGAEKVFTSRTEAEDAEESNHARQR